MGKKSLTSTNILQLVFLAILVVAISCRPAVPGPSDGPVASAKRILAENAGIATAHPAASKIGLDILKSGGNAVDAAIATQFALAVCYPVAGNIGGGGFMVLRNADGTIDALDFRETAPLGANRDMYLDSAGNVVPRLSLDGHLAAGVPGSVDGMVKAFEKYSKLGDWGSLVQPSIDLARQGVALTAREAANLNNSRNRFVQFNTRTPRFISDGTWEKDMVLKQPELAATLEAIRDQKEAGFYEGWVADSIVAEMERGGGLINHEDLSSYTAVWRQPLVGNYKGYDVISMPPPSSGGIALQQLLGSIEEFPISDYGFHSVQAVHLMVEAERRVYADRATHLGDIDYYPVPVGTLMDETYIRRRMESYDAKRATSSKMIDAGTIPLPESEQTTHFSIVDAEGNAVSVTTTINTGYGSKVVVGGAGFLLNNEMDDFSAKPGVPNFFGLIGNEANSIQPGKRMLSSMTPTILSKDDQLVLVVGTPGGSTIITSVFQVVVNILDFGMTADEAVQACRFHHQWVPDRVFFESGCFAGSLLDSLSRMGHEMEDRSTRTGGQGHIGRVEAVLVQKDGTLEVVADRRGDDAAMGY